jgi:hypothetical protein
VSLNDRGFNYNLNLLIMKKQILNLGTVINKAQQQKINGGHISGEECGYATSSQCWSSCFTYCSPCFGGGWQCVVFNLELDD